MRTLLTTIFLIFSSTIFGQYIENDGSFTREYTSIRGYKNVDGELIYDEGSAVQWTFVFNVNFFTSADGREMLGAVMNNAEGQPRYFYNYIGDIYESEDEDGHFGEFRVDILHYNDDNARWEFWEQGTLRYYGTHTSLFLGRPSWYLFVYME
jgi:hypothetical protein